MDGTIDTDHTFADDSPQGQGTAGKLMGVPAEYLRAQDKKAVLAYSYTVRRFEKHLKYYGLIK